MSKDFSLLSALITSVKIFIGLFIFRSILFALGYKGYVPILDEVFWSVMNFLLSIGGNSSSSYHGI